GETLRRPLEQLCGRRFGPAGVVHSDGMTRMVFSERASYQAETGWAQHICRGAQMCGDHYEFFHDGSGRAVMVLSDGMGSGGRAAVDSAMTCGILSRLVLSGLGYDCALRMINSSLYVKSGDESLATVDIATVDLYTGQAVFRKAGAAAGFVRRGTEVEVIDLASLPAGILQDVRFASTERALQPGDWVVLVSDGAVVNGTEWLTECIRSAEGTPQELSDAILQCAAQQRKDGHDDDVTAAVLRLKAG
ncbi:MAG: SpoIIE family protein phosphatase, partial [Clostridia bacterium]|nr:SpoIIE family protein phosphatase [Clostridia bacterium]